MLVPFRWRIRFKFPFFGIYLSTQTWHSIMEMPAYYAFRAVLRFDNSRQLREDLQHLNHVEFQTYVFQMLQVFAATVELKQGAL